VQRLNALNSTVTQAKTERIAAEALYRQLAASQNDRGALDTFPLIRSNGQVQQIRERLATLQRERMQLSSTLGAKHPDMVRVATAIDAGERELATEIAKTVESIRQEYLAALSREKELAAALDTQKASALALNRQAIDYGVLLRDAESNRQIYQNLLQRTNETAVSSDLSNELKNSDIEVVDAAEVPRAPVRPNTGSNLLIGLLLGTVLAIGVAGVLEAVDSRIQTPADVKRALRLPFLGMLPYVSDRALKGSAPLLSTGVPAVYAEACRSLRTNVLASAGVKGSRSLLVTSAAPGDGKSIVAVNLAVALGRSGRRVLVVDADLRRPVLHELMDRKQHPGLSEVLTGTRKPSEAVVATRCSGVWLLPSGSCPSNPSELLGSKRFKEFLDKLGDYFDWVIIDSPPVMAVTDPAVVAHLASGVLFVVNARRTNRRVAQAALDRLETAGASFAGAVLNAVTLDRDHYYNAHSYLPFYGDYLSDKRTA
jgi:polysaccharide biosynthesis transport protein